MGMSRDGRGDGRAAPAVRVLVAEDEALIALDLEAALRGLGCAVLGPVPTVAGALALLAGGGPRPDAALLDPGLRDGWAAPVAAALAAAGVPFAVVTGHGPEVVAADPALRDAPRLAKPYRDEELRAVLARLTASAAARSPSGDPPSAAPVRQPGRGGDLGQRQADRAQQPLRAPLERRARPVLVG
jgi:DNA-binding LytR/AlgR family response regulator